MTHPFRWSVLLSCSLFTGCVTYSDSMAPIGAEDYELASRTDAAGARATYTLDVLAGSGEAKLRVETETQHERPALGISVNELDKPRAEQRGVKPFSGLLVTRVTEGSSAAAAGLQAGDVLLALDGKETVYDQQIAQVEAALRKDQVVAAKVLRGQSEQTLPLTTKVLAASERRTEHVPLERAPIEHRPYAGVTLRGIPADWCQKIWGTPRNAVIVTSVTLGSPAWIAGVRGGDVIETVDGAPVPPVAEVSRLIAERGPRGESIQWRLRRGEQVHDATVDLHDFSGEANVWIPLIFRLEDGVEQDVWTVGPLGLLLANRNHYVANTRTRAVQKRNVFHALLGLIRVETTPDETDVRLLWIIHFDT